MSFSPLGRGHCQVKHQNREVTLRHATPITKYKACISLCSRSPQATHSCNRHLMTACTEPGPMLAARMQGKDDSSRIWCLSWLLGSNLWFQRKTGGKKSLQTNFPHISIWIKEHTDWIYFLERTQRCHLEVGALVHRGGPLAFWGTHILLQVLSRAHVKLCFPSLRYERTLVFLEGWGALASFSSLRNSCLSLRRPSLPHVGLGVKSLDSVPKLLSWDWPSSCPLGTLSL